MIANLYETGYAIQPPITIPGNPITTATKSSDIAVASLKGATTVTKPDPDADISPTNIATITGIANPTITASSGAASNSQTISGELYSLPNGTADEYDGQAAKLTRRIGKIVLDGTETWAITQANNPYFFTTEFLLYPGPHQGISTHFKEIVMSSANDEIGFDLATNGRVFVRPGSTIATTVEDWTAYLATQAEAGTPFTVYYDLCNPEITEAAYDLTCYDGNTTFSAPSVPVENLSVTLLDGRTVGNAARLGGQPPYVYQQSNPNLLINGGFQVWQRGTEFTNPRNQYVLDMFRDVSGSGEAEMVYQKVEEGLFVSFFSESTYLNLITFIDLEKQPYLRGEKLTLSTFISQLAGDHFRLRATESPGLLVLPYKENLWQPLALGLNTITFTVTEDPAIKYLCLGFTRPSGAASTAQESFTANYLKLELGPVATPYVPADYGTELAKCQRYLLPVQGNVVLPGAVISGGADIIIALCSFYTPVTLASLPTLTDTEPTNYRVRVEDTFYTPTAVQINRVASNSVTIFFGLPEAANAYLNHPCTGWYYTNENSAFLSAEL